MFSLSLHTTVGADNELETQMESTRGVSGVVERVGRTRPNAAARTGREETSAKVA
jgi:hypothetical protein